MAVKRTYGDQCGIARALDLVGERWALLVVRELLFGPKRFTDLRAGLPNVSPDVLSQRLRDLDQAGVLRRRALEPPAATNVYELTDRGRDLEHVLLELGRWGTEAPFPPDGAVFGSDSLILALRTVFDPHAAGDLEARYELLLGRDRFRAAVTEGRLDLARGSDEGADVSIEAEVGVVAELLWRGRELDEAVRAGDVAIEGNRRAAKRFLRLFPAPAGD
jgi:DNA-binding HxlR family transcriptional regulator